MNPHTGAVEALAATGILRHRAMVPAGATVDVVTAAAALSSGRCAPSSQISGASPFGSARSEVHNELGQLTLSDAMTLSVNTVLARVGAGRGAAAAVMSAEPPTTAPTDEAAESARDTALHKQRNHHHRRVTQPGIALDLIAGDPGCDHSDRSP
jgi:hypothetical protein